MLTERPPTQRVSPTPVSLGLNVLLEKTDLRRIPPRADNCWV